MKGKIFFNALQYSLNGAGISKYIKKLSEEYLQNYENISILVRSKALFDIDKDNLLAYDKEVNNSKQRIFSEQIGIRHLFKNYDLIHYPDYAMPIFTDKPCVITVHDMNRCALPELWTKMQKLIFRTFMSITVNKAEKIICDSNFTAKELIKYYPKIDGSKIETVLLGFEADIKTDIKKNFEDVAKEYKITKPYMLYVGTISPHKNIKRMVEAFSNVKKQGHDYQLVIAGKKGWMYDEIFKTVKEKDLETEVIFTDYASDENLELLYRNCLFSIFVSLYEGFGFPPLEAMARKKPVLVSDSASIPEVVGDAGLYCNPLEVEDISKKMVELIENDDLRNNLINEGTDRLKVFNWDKTAKETYKVYDKILYKKKKVQA